MTREEAQQKYQQAFQARANSIMYGSSISPEYQAILNQYQSADSYANAVAPELPGGGSVSTGGGNNGLGLVTESPPPNTNVNTLTPPASAQGNPTSTPAPVQTNSAPPPPSPTPPSPSPSPPPPNGSGLGLTTGVGAGNSNKLGSSAYQTLLGTYQTIYPGAQINTPEGQQQFNQWTNGIMQQTGATSWEDIPITFSQGMPANSTQGGPGGPGTAVVPSGSNYQQNQAGNQSGAFTTTGNTNQNQTVTTGQNTTSQGATNQTGTTTNNQSTTGGFNELTNQNQTQTGTSTTAPVDTLGFGSLLQGAVGQAQTNDTNRGAFLTDVMQTGGQQFGSQVDQAVRNSLTGPQMTGAGDSARARAAGYAGAQVGRQNLDQRLGAAQQLGGPTGLQHLVAAGQPFMGQQTSNTGTSATTGGTSGTSFQDLVAQGTNALNSVQNNTSATTGIQNMVSNQNESQSGTATGNSNQSAAGVIPQAQTVNTGGSGGCVICTVGLETGHFRTPRLLRHVVNHKLNRDWPTFRNAVRGYLTFLTPFAALSLTRPWLSRFAMMYAKPVVYEELRISGRRLPFKLIPWVFHWTWHYVCDFLGEFRIGGRITNQRVLDTARKHNVLFNLEGK